MRHVTSLFAFLALALSAPSGHAQAPVDVSGTWTVELHDGKAFLQVRTSPPPDSTRSNDWNGGWSMGQSVAPEEITGIRAGDSRLTLSNAKFELRREAGTLAFEGSFRDGRGAGLFTFTQRPEFTAEMRRLGYTEDMQSWQRYQFAVQDVGPRYINALKAEGYDKLTLDQIRRTRSHGVTIEYIKAMKAEGHRAATIEDFVRTRDHGVTPQFVQEMRGLGFTGSTLDGFVRLRDHGVSADYVADMKQIGLRDLTLEQIVKLRDHGITPGFVSHARARGFKPADADELIRLKNRGLW